MSNPSPILAVTAASKRESASLKKFMSFLVFLCCNLTTYSVVLMTVIIRTTYTKKFIANNIALASSTSKYTASFLLHKVRSERFPMNYVSFNNSIPYNRLVTHLQKRVRETTPRIMYEYLCMFSHLLRPISSSSSSCY